MDNIKINWTWPVIERTFFPQYRKFLRLYVRILIIKKITSIAGQPRSAFRSALPPQMRRQSFRREADNAALTQNYS